MGRGVKLKTTLPFFFFSLSLCTESEASLYIITTIEFLFSSQYHLQPPFDSSHNQIPRKLQLQEAMEFDLENPLTTETIPDLFAAESDHMPSHSFLATIKNSNFLVSFRRDAISLILQVQFSSNLDPFMSYLAVNYMDRFISRQEIQQEKPWMLRLIAISCLSLASKMKTIPLSLTDFQRDEGFIFDAQSINRMELVILDALNWRMRSITPFSFVPFLISLFELKDPPLTQALKDRASEIIFKSHHEIKLLEFKPSVIAASSLLSASYELFPMQFPAFKTSILSCGYINQEGLAQCFNAMQEMVVTEGYESVLETASSTRTPMSVLESTTMSMSGGNATQEKRDSKRRKVSGVCSGARFQFSQIQHC